MEQEPACRLAIAVVDRVHELDPALLRGLDVLLGQLLGVPVGVPVGLPVGVGGLGATARLPAGVGGLGATARLPAGVGGLGVAVGLPAGVGGLGVAVGLPAGVCRLLAPVAGLELLAILRSGLLDHGILLGDRFLAVTSPTGGGPHGQSQGPEADRGAPGDTADECIHELSSPS